MKQKIKNRILAREILILVSSLVLVLVLCAIPWIQNIYCQKHISVLVEKENSIIKLLQPDNSRLVTDPALIAELNAVAGIKESDGISVKQKQLQEEKNNVEISIGNYEHRIYSAADLFDYVLVCSLIIIGAAYIIRPIVFGVAWSINILRNESKSFPDNPEPMT